MTDSIAGAVTIEIGGNLAPFEAALEKGRQIAATFDAQISSKLSGGVTAGLEKIAAGVERTNELLSKMTGAGTQAGTAMEKITGAATSATSAVAQLTATSTSANAEIAKMGSGGAAAGLGAATVSAKEFAAALQAAGGNLGKVNVGLEEQSQEVKAVTDSLRGYSRAQIDVFRSQQEGEEFNRSLTERVGILNTATKSARDSAAAFQAFGLTETEVALGAREVSGGINAGATAAKLGAAQMASLGHSARSAVESLALGVSPLQALTMQANHLSFAFGGPQGVIAASAGARAAFTGFLTSATGIITTAGVAAVAGLAGYIIATRNSIQSVDEVLSEHKALIDEIAGAYPEAAKAAASYAEAAKRIPKSVATADIVEQAKENKKTLDDTLGFLSTRLHGASEEWGLFGSAGTKAFGDLAQIANSGVADAADQIESALGRMRIDPNLNENARDLAKQLQGDATAAAKLQDALNEKNTIKDIVADGAKAAQTLFDVSKGFGDVSSKAGGADASISKLFGTLNSGGSDRFGVTRSANLFGNSLQATVGMFEDVNSAVQKSRQDQVAGMVQLESQLRDTTTEADRLKKALATTGSKDNIDAFFGDTSNIKNANSEIERATSTVGKLFDALNSGTTTTRSVFEGLDLIRQTLIRDGFGVDAVNKFIDSLVRTRMQLDSDISGAKQMNAAIQAIKNKTVTITVVTRKVGTGTQSTYDVPNESGSGSSSVGVTRYGGQSDMTQESYSVPSYNGGAESSGYGSSYGVSGGTSGVTVTRFGGTRASGGPMDALTPYLVGEHGPELVIPRGAATVIPNAQTTPLASAQSGFTGREATREQDRYWTVMMNIEANTRKTAQLLDEIKASTASSGLGGGSYGSSGTGSSAFDSSTGLDVAGHTAEQVATFDRVFKAYQANFKAAGILAGQPIGYGLGSSSSPRQIAENIAYGGMSPTVGFATGGIMGGDSGDTEKVEFFKNPNERVIIARPDQFQDARSQPKTPSDAGSAGRPIAFSQVNHWNGNAPPSRDSLAAVRRQTALGFMDAERAKNGR